MKEISSLSQSPLLVNRSTSPPHSHWFTAKLENEASDCVSEWLWPKSCPVCVGCLLSSWLLNGKALTFSMMYPIIWDVLTHANTLTPLCVHTRWRWVGVSVCACVFLWRKDRFIEAIYLFRRPQLLLSWSNVIISVRRPSLRAVRGVCVWLSVVRCVVMCVLFVINWEDQILR